MRSKQIELSRHSDVASTVGAIDHFRLIQLHGQYSLHSLNPYLPGLHANQGATGLAH